MHSLKMPSASSNKPQCVLSDTEEETKECTQNTGRSSLGCLDMFVRARMFICLWYICIYNNNKVYFRQDVHICIHKIK